ncbi:MAG: OmpA family protein [Rickettsiales bacterium]|jgi:chemotaxis protein MotB|nr:OmpA family protein [Rickettsiales bacterium]
MIPPRKQVPQEDTDSWLMSYADLITLLMCFFIIFVSVSEPKKDKFTLITDGLANKFGAVDMSTPLHGVYSSLQGLIENNQLFRDAVIQKNAKSIEMELASDAFFKRDSAEFVEAKIAILKELAAGLKSGAYLDYHIIIEGHTSDRKASGAFESNWELSSARATKMVRFFIEHGIESNRLIAVSFADSKPKLPNLDSTGEPIENNRAQNERMVIKFERK